MFSASSSERYTPASLANLKAPPVFLLKSCGRRDRERFSRDLIVEGARFHDKHAMRRELMKALRHLWNESDFEAQFPRVQALWDAIDEHEVASAGGNDPVEFTYAPAERQRIQELIDRATQAWPPLREIEADNVAYANLFPRLALSRVLTGWENFGLHFKLEWGVVSLHRVDQIETALGRIEDEARAAQVGGVKQTGTAFLELSAAVSNRLFDHAGHSDDLENSNPNSLSRIHTGASPKEKL